MPIDSDMAIEHEIDSPFALAVRAIGSQSEMARLIGKGQATVYARLKSGKPIWDDKDVLDKIAKATGMGREELRPDLFGPEQSTPQTSTTVPASLEPTR